MGECRSVAPLGSRHCIADRGRRELAPGTDRYDAYYTSHPERQRYDETTRNMPGILSPDSLGARTLMFASAIANFEVICPSSWTIGTSPRRFAKVMDDVVYRRKSGPFEPHEWQRITTSADRQ